MLLAQIISDIWFFIGIVAIIYSLIFMWRVKSNVLNGQQDQAPLTSQEKATVFITCLFAPLINQAVYYYGWRKSLPVKAKSANNFGWLAALVAGIVMVGISWLHPTARPATPTVGNTSSQVTATSTTPTSRRSPKNVTEALHDQIVIDVMGQLWNALAGRFRFFGSYPQRLTYSQSDPKNSLYQTSTAKTPMSELKSLGYRYVYTASPRGSSYSLCTTLSTGKNYCMTNTNRPSLAVTEVFSQNSAQIALADLASAAIKMYASSHGTYPSSLTDVRPNDANLNQAIKDVEGLHYIYSSTKTTYSLCTKPLFIEGGTLEQGTLRLSTKRYCSEENILLPKSANHQLTADIDIMHSALTAYAGIFGKFPRSADQINLGDQTIINAFSELKTANYTYIPDSSLSSYSLCVPIGIGNFCEKGYLAPLGGFFLGKKKLGV